MNPHVTIHWVELIFPFLITVIVAAQLWWRKPARTDRLYVAGSMLVVVALAGAAVANLYYQRLLYVRAWPVTGFFEQSIVTSAGEVFITLGDPIMGRASRIQRYGCDGVFMTAYEPDNRGGAFKIAVQPDNALLIYSVRSDTIDTFAADGRYVGRQNVSSRDMPFEFLKSGPSVNKADECEFDPTSGKVALGNAQQTVSLEEGDWLLEYVLNRLNIFGVGFLGAILVAISFIRERAKFAA